MRAIVFLLAFTLSGCAAMPITVKTIVDCPTYRDQKAPESVKQWFTAQYPDGKAAPGVPDELAIWLKRVADNTQALNQACGVTNGK